MVRSWLSPAADAMPRFPIRRARVSFYSVISRGQQQTAVAAPDDATASPVGLAFSADGSKLYLASAAARSVASFDLQSGDRSAIACSCSPASLVSMGSLFRLSEAGPDPLWLFDAGASEPRIVFVPAIAAQ